MKKIIKLIPILISVLLIGISSCKNDTNLLTENNKWINLDSTNSANVKFIQVFAGNTPNLPTTPSLLSGPQVFIYANGVKLNGAALSYIGGNTFTGTSTTPNALGLPWPISNVYANIPSGSTRFDIINARINLAVVPSVPAFNAGDTLTSFTAVLDKGKYYSLYIGDTVPTVRVTLKEDNLIVPAYQTYKIRLANFIMGPLDTLNLYSRRQQAEIITGVTHKNISDWVQIALPIIADTLEIRKKGSTTTYLTVIGNGVGAIPPPAFTPTGLRMYTIIARGKSTVTGKIPAANIIINR